MGSGLSVAYIIVLKLVNGKTFKIRTRLAGGLYLWSHLQNQIFLGTEKFINNNLDQIKKQETLNEVPQLQKRKLPKSLEYYDNKYSNQKKAIFNAYLSGGYTLKEIGDYFGKHYSTISRIIKEQE